MWRKLLDGSDGVDGYRLVLFIMSVGAIEELKARLMAGLDALLNVLIICCFL